MVERAKCPNKGCSRQIAGDLRIDTNGKGFRRVSLGWKCQACGSVTRSVADLAVEVATETALAHGFH